MVYSRLLSIIGALLLCIGMTAAPVTRETARLQAGQFLQQRHGDAAARGMRLAELPATEADKQAAYYAFNVGQGQGFVLISGDDRVEPVLGYADEGSFCQEQMPDNLRAWLQGYQRELEWLDEQGIQTQAAARVMRKAGVRTSISPLITTRWDQGTPYNDLCPLNNAEVRTVTGCVATAISQLLYFYGQPVQTIAAIPAYQTTSLGLVIQQKPVTTLQWELMQESHAAGTTAEQDAAVATLMALVGAAFEMDYNTEANGGSGASADEAPTVLATYFGYDPDAKMVYRNDYTYTDWIDLIYYQLKSGNPVLYNGQSTGGGHAFVCDGYDEDDYFHINWGWGGRSNGYYRLSILQPEDQGAGGSSNMSAFSYDQGVMVNVKPQDDGIDETGRTRLTASTIGAYGVYTYNRASVENNFFNVHVSTLFHNMTGSAQTFDVGLGLFDEEDQLTQVLWSEALPELPYLSGFNYSTYPSFGSGISEGVYRIKNISKLHADDNWMASYASERHYITATIEGNTLTLEELNVSDDNASNLSAVLALEGTAIKGKDTKVVATVTNNSTGLYTGNLKLIRKGDDSKYYMLAGTQVDIEPGATIEVPFTFKPASSERYNVILWDKSTKNISPAMLSIDVSVGESAVNGLLTHVQTTLKNGDIGAGVVFGSTAKATVTLCNTDTKDHTSGLFVWMFKWTDMGGGSYQGASVTTKTIDVTIPAGETRDVDFEVKGLEAGELYSFRYHYVDDIYNNPIGNSKMFRSVNGITTYMADGTASVSREQPTLTVDDDVVAIDLSGITLTSLTPNANPNTLYIFGPDDEVPATLSGKNVVKGGTTSRLTLSDGYDFYSPIAFTAEEATYTRQFTQAADGKNGWSTIVVPFDVDRVMSGAKVIDWFHSSSDTGKNFWLKEFSSETEGTVYFNFADEMKAYMPYIIAMPGNKWGESWNLTNRDITFIGENVNISADAKAVVNGTTFKFAGMTRSTEVTNEFLLNAAGNAFEKTSATLEAFRACFRSVGYTSTSVLGIASEGANPTGIESIESPVQGEPSAIFSLQGIRQHGQSGTLPKGIYIMNGKKVVK